MDADSTELHLSGQATSTPFPGPSLSSPSNACGEGREGASPPESSDMGREGRGKKETRDGRKLTSCRASSDSLGGQ